MDVRRPIFTSHLSRNMFIGIGGKSRELNCEDESIDVHHKQECSTGKEQDSQYLASHFY